MPRQKTLVRTLIATCTVSSLFLSACSSEDNSDENSTPDPSNTSNTNADASKGDTEDDVSRTWTSTDPDDHICNDTDLEVHPQENGDDHPIIGVPTPPGLTVTSETPLNIRLPFLDSYSVFTAANTGPEPGAIGFTGGTVESFGTPEETLRRWESSTPEGPAWVKEDNFSKIETSTCGYYSERHTGEFGATMQDVLVTVIPLDKEYLISLVSVMESSDDRGFIDENAQQVFDGLQISNVNGLD